MDTSSLLLADHLNSLGNLPLVCVLRTWQWWAKAAAVMFWNVRMTSLACPWRHIMYGELSLWSCLQCLTRILFSSISSYNRINWMKQVSSRLFKDIPICAPCVAIATRIATWQPSIVSPCHEWVVSIRTEQPGGLDFFGHKRLWWQLEHLPFPWIISFPWWSAILFR